MPSTHDLYSRSIIIIQFSDQTAYHHCSKHKYQHALYVARIMFVTVILFQDQLQFKRFVNGLADLSNKVYPTRIQYCSTSYVMDGGQKTYITMIKDKHAFCQNNHCILFDSNIKKEYVRSLVYQVKYIEKIAMMQSMHFGQQ